MIVFLRKLRKNTIENNKLSKYLIYAIGEVILVVIGILIALWINNLNNSFRDAAKERIILSEIRENLVADTLQISNLKAFHEVKKKEIYSILNIIAQNEASEKNREIVLGYFTTGTLFQVKDFESKSVGYDNLINSGNIDLLKNRELKNLLTQYYLTTSSNVGALETLKESTRKFKEYIIPKTINNWSLKKLTGLNFALDNEEYITGLNDDEQAISSLILMSMQIDFSEDTLIDLNKDIKGIISKIDLKIKNE